MERFIRSSFLVFFSNINPRTCNESIWKGFGTIASQNRRHFGKGLRISLPWHSRGTWVRAPSLPSWRFFVRQVTPRVKKISSFFDALPSRKHPSMAEDPKAELQCSQEDHVMQHEEKKMCDQRSKNFQPSWKKTYPWLRFHWRKNVLCNLCGLKQKRLEISKSELVFCHRDRQFPFGFNEKSWKFHSSRTGNKSFFVSMRSWESFPSKSTCCCIRRSAIEDEKIIWGSLFRCQAWTSIHGIWKMSGERQDTRRLMVPNPLAFCRCLFSGLVLD